MERSVRERQRRSDAFQRLAAIVPCRGDLDDVNAERPQTRSGDSDVRLPGFGGDGARGPEGQLREPLTAARAEIEQVGRPPSVLNSAGGVIPRERLRLKSTPSQLKSQPVKGWRSASSSRASTRTGSPTFWKIRWTEAPRNALGSSSATLAASIRTIDESERRG